MPYSFTKNTADVAVEVEAITMEDLFALSCHAWRDVALESGDTSSTDWKFFYFKSDSPENLLVQLLNDLNSQLFSNNWVFNSIEDLKIIIEDNSFKLYADIYGESFNPETHKLKEEIKSIANNKMKIEKMNGCFTIKLTLDI